jgi:signal transduction histidine kinase/CheY-like chemotaxis protein
VTASALLTVAVHTERDVVLARQRARHVAGLLGFDTQDQTRISTAISEVARNAFEYAGGGKVEIAVEGRTLPQLLVITVSDQGPGIADVQAILSGRYDSPTGMGLGLVGARRLMDQFDLSSTPGRGTRVVLKKLLPRRARLIDAKALGEIAGALTRSPAADPLEELHRQNQELLNALSELERRGQELTAMNRELEDTNRGVIALYAELDEKADHLRRADELKSRFLSNMSHEFRTPVNSIQALARMLLQRLDGELTPEQTRQVSFIAKAADSLAELVSDLLDLAKVEAGKIVVRPVEFAADHLFGALRGMLRPLLVSDAVALVFDEPHGVPPLYTDEGKVSQILRNFISNAFKFTERGEIRVAVRAPGDDGRVVFSVSDTGIGIAPEDQERIFQEFTQIDSPLQRKVHGTGLGLPLCRKLAEILGGSVAVESAPGVGSTFSVRIPAIYREGPTVRAEWKLEPHRLPVLVVEDSLEMILIYERMLADSKYQVLAAHTLREAREALDAFQPCAIVLDILLRGEDSWTLLADLKKRTETRGIPVAVISTVEDERKMLALGADAVCVKPIDRGRLLETLTRMCEPQSLRRVLIVDDDEVSRYVLRQELTRANVILSEAASGAMALEQARSTHPDVVFLDLSLGDMDGRDVLERLRADPELRDIPVVIVTGTDLDDRARNALLERADDVLPKHALASERARRVFDAVLARPSGRMA